MRIEDTTPETSGEAPGKEQHDPFMAKLRDLPRMSSAASADGKAYLPPAPTTSRIAAFTQGCAGLVVILLALPMLLSALLYGFYLWGPGLMLSGGVLLMGALLGIWRGRRLALVVSLLVTLGLAALMYQWRYFIFAAAALSPFGQVTGMLFNIGLPVGIMALLITVVVHLISLVYWKRLLPPAAQWSIPVWIVALVVATVLPVAIHFTTQQQREDKLLQERDDWLDDAQADELVMGVNGGVALGYSFAVNSDDPERTDDNFDVRLAELDAALDTGASPVRVAASGDTLLEAEEPRIFVSDGNGEEDAEPDAEYSAERLAVQLDYEERYMEHIAESGAALLISDSQYSPYLLTRANDEEAEPLTWDEFSALHEERIRYYANAYQPLAYIVVTEPASYPTYSGIELPSEDDEENLDAWIEHTERLIAAVRDEVPGALVGVTVSLDDDFELSYYERALELDELDFISMDIFQDAAFTRIQDILDEHGHPADHDKGLWITETWYGYCMSPQRSMELDSLWLETVTAFAAKENFEAVLPSSFGCFLQPGGTLMLPDVNTTGRTGAWETWRSLVEAWHTPLAPEEE